MIHQHQAGSGAEVRTSLPPATMKSTPMNPTATQILSEPTNPYRESGDEIYDRLSRNRKAVIVAVMSFCAFLSPISSTSILAATPEVAAEFHTTGSVINASNAGYMAFMGLSPIFWGPMSQVFGRQPVSLRLSLRQCRNEVVPQSLR